MSRARRLIAFASVPVWLAGCSSDQVAGPDGALDTAANPSAVSIASVDGEWSFSRLVQITAPAWVAQQIFGIEPEGAITHIRCESTGTMQLNQAGDAFSGTADMTSACETSGGQVFEPAGADINIVEGAIHGMGLRFAWVEDEILSCPHHGVITQVVDGTADRLSGTGRCVLPGHPLSPVPLNPPPAGTSKVLSLEAWRS